MKLEEQVVSLKLALRLKKLGVKQESFFGWSLEHKRLISSGSVETWIGKDRASAFTVAELAEMLNTELTDQNENDSFTLQCTNAIDFWAVAFGNDEITITPQFENAKLADALAEILNLSFGE
jgi:hypothetical protein